MLTKCSRIKPLLIKFTDKHLSYFQSTKLATWECHAVLNVYFALKLRHNTLSKEVHCHLLRILNSVALCYWCNFHKKYFFKETVSFRVSPWYTKIHVKGRQSKQLTVRLSTAEALWTIPLVFGALPVCSLSHKVISEFRAAGSQ